MLRHYVRKYDAVLCLKESLQGTFFTTVPPTPVYLTTKSNIDKAVVTAKVRAQGSENH
jgi:hypothetical protein